MAGKTPGRLGNRALTDALRTLSEEMISVTDDGTPLTRAQKLAEAVWKLALGHYSKEKDSEGKVKAAMAIQEEQQGIRAADKVRQLSVDRINKLAGAKVGGPPKFKPRGDK